jgi:hypothetical protein
MVWGRTTCTEQRNETTVYFLDHGEETVEVGAPFRKAGRVDAEDWNPGRRRVPRIRGGIRERIDPWIEGYTSLDWDRG